MRRLILLVSFLAFQGNPAPEGPALQFESPPELAAVTRRLESVTPTQLRDVVQLVGGENAGPPIHVVLALETSPLAREIPPWIAGFAAGESDLIVIFPARALTYPNDTLEDVLRHEVAHVLIWRASLGRPVPRWFNEGLAMTAEHERRFQDQTQLLYQLITGSAANLEELNRLFSGTQGDQTRAYALAGALVADMFQKYGASAGRNIVIRVGRGASFDAAFTDVTGLSPATFESEFWRGQRIWTSWLPILTSSTILWLAVTGLAILAIYMRRRRNRQIEERWAREDGDIEN